MSDQGKAVISDQCILEAERMLSAYISVPQGLRKQTAKAMLEARALFVGQENCQAVVGLIVAAISQASACAGISPRDAGEIVGYAAWRLGHEMEAMQGAEGPKH